MSLWHKLWFCGRKWKGCVCCRLHAYLGVNFDGNPNWVLNFDFLKQVLNNARLGIILFQTWHLSPNYHHFRSSWHGCNHVITKSQIPMNL